MKQNPPPTARKNATKHIVCDAQIQASRARGILYPQLAQQHYQHFVEILSPELQTHIQHCWMVRWDTQQQSLSQLVLSHPHCHLVFEDNTLNFYGVQSSIFHKHLEGKGQAFGIKFQPASAWGLWRLVMKSLCNQKIAVPEWAQRYWPGLDLAWASQADWPDLLQHVLPGLARFELAAHEKITRLNALVANLAQNASDSSVASLAAAMACSPRQLQRDCAHYVGIHPKWLIQRFRLHQALAELQTKSHQAPDLARLALQAGYYDQAHFTADFIAITGYSPHAYWRYLHQAL